MVEGLHYIVVVWSGIGEALRGPQLKLELKLRPELEQSSTDWIPQRWPN